MAAAADILTNLTELTVSELSGALKRTVEDRFGHVRVRGEISGFRGPHSSGHVYFSLKDGGARIDAVIWKTTFQRMKVRPEEGLEVVATGKVTTFPGKSAYQIVIESVEPAGLGALMALIEERRRRFAAEGLFDAARKRPIPYLPVSIGVVTSPTGAVIRDILHRLAARFPRRVLLWPVRVQGETSGSEVAAAIAGFNALAETGAMPRPSLIIVARGGGSLEDLWGFNDEAVVRAAAASRIPLISAVGHETDWTLIDHVADLRAPTPTGAAEMCVPVLHELLSQTADLERRRRGALRRLFDRRRSELRAAARALPSGDTLVAVPRQRLDRGGERLHARMSAYVAERRRRLERTAPVLARHSPQAELAEKRERFKGVAARLDRARAEPARRKAERLAEARRRLAAALLSGAERRMAGQNRLQSAGTRLVGTHRRGLARRAMQIENVWKLVQSLGYKGVLARGFVLVRDEAGRPVRQAQGVQPGRVLELEFSDGVAAVQGTGDPPRREPKSKTKPADRSSQGFLF